MLDEVAGYKDTMQKAGNNFNQNTFMGRIRSKLQPQKYQQYQRIQKQGDEMGASATDKINDTLDTMGDDYVNHGDVTVPDYANYYRQQNPNTDNSWYQNHKMGEEQFSNNHAAQLGWRKKYGTGGRIAKPYGWNSSIDKERDIYNQQRQAIKNGQI